MTPVNENAKTIRDLAAYVCDRLAGSVAADYMENGGFEEMDGEDCDLPF